MDEGNSPEMNVAKMAGRNVNGVTKEFIGLLRRYDEPLTFKMRMAFSGKDLTHLEKKRERLLSMVRHKMKAHMYEMGGVNVEHYFQRHNHDGTLSYDEFVHAARKSCEIDDEDAIMLIKAVDTSRLGHIRLKDLKAFLLVTKRNGGDDDDDDDDDDEYAASSSPKYNVIFSKRHHNKSHHHSARKIHKKADISSLRSRVLELEQQVQAQNVELQKSITTHHSDEMKIQKMKKLYDDLHVRHSHKSEELLRCRRELERANQKIRELTKTIAELHRKDPVITSPITTRTTTSEMMMKNNTNRFMPSSLPPRQVTIDVAKRVDKIKNSMDSTDKKKIRENPPSLSQIRPWHGSSGLRQEVEKQSEKKEEKTVKGVITSTPSPPLTRIRPWRSHRRHDAISSVPSLEEREKWLGHQNTPVLGDTLWRRLSWWPTSHHSSHNTAFQKMILGRRRRGSYDFSSAG